MYRIYYRIPVMMFSVILMCLAAVAQAGYIEQEIEFQSSDKDNNIIRLSGTLTLPDKGTGHPAVVFIGGSGRYSREAQNEPFDVLARHFAQMGVASLYFDKRGCGGSGGEYLSSTTWDFLRDTEKAIEYLDTVKDINPNKIVLFGHSEGGIIASMICLELKTGLHHALWLSSPFIECHG